MALIQNVASTDVRRAADLNQYSRALRNVLGIQYTTIAEQPALGRLVLPRSSAAPAAPAEGQLYYDTDDDKPLYRFGTTAWAGFGLGIRQWLQDELEADIALSGDNSRQVMKIDVLPLGTAPVFLLVAQLHVIFQLKVTPSPPGLPAGGDVGFTPWLRYAYPASAGQPQDFIYMLGCEHSWNINAGVAANIDLAYFETLFTMQCLAAVNPGQTVTFEVRCPGDRSHRLTPFLLGTGAPGDGHLNGLYPGAFTKGGLPKSKFYAIELA